jgi:hypothetical protein
MTVGVKGFQKGQSGNPGGRRKEDAKVKDFAKEHTQLAIDTLVNLCKNGKAESTKLAAAIALLDRGWGRPAQAIIGGDDDDPPIQVAEIVIRAVDAAADRSTAQGS